MSKKCSICQPNTRVAPRPRTDDVDDRCQAGLRRRKLHEIIGGGSSRTAPQRPAPVSKHVHAEGFQRRRAEDHAEQPSRDAPAERAVRRLAHRLNVRPQSNLRKTAGLLFTRARFAVLADGYCGHGRPEGFKTLSTNREGWDDKIGQNRLSDIEATVLVEERGWRLARF